MTVWNLRELRELIEKIHGPEQLQKAISHINSVDWKIRAASYHSYAASNAFSGVFEGVVDSQFSVMKMMFSNGEEASDFREARFIYEANVIACAQAMHSVADIISHVILDSLALKGVDEETLNLKVVHKALSSGDLKQRIAKVMGMTKFRYLHDFVNTSKHVRLVDAEYNVDLTGTAKHAHGVRFKQFECKGRLHGAKWGEEFLLELRQLSIEYVGLGQELNKHLISNDS